MKKTIIALMALVSVASAEYSIETTQSMYDGAWVYVWTGNGDNNNWENGDNWRYYKSTKDSQGTTTSDYKPDSKNPAIIGYDFSFVDEKQVLTANNTAITVTMPTWSENYTDNIYLGHNVTLSGSNNAFRQNRTHTFDFGDFGGSSVISMEDFWMQTGVTINFTGTITMTGTEFSYTVFTSTKMEQNDGTWNASGVTVTDAQGNTLQYTTDESKIGTSGYYWLDSTYTVKGSANTVKIVARAVPEPATATLSLLALCGLAARRRRK